MQDIDIDFVINCNFQYIHYFRYLLKKSEVKAEQILDDKRFIEASDLFLKEIELLVNENTDFNKDKHKIQSLLKKFEEIERELVIRYSFKVNLINSLRSIQFIKVNEEAKKIQSSILEIRERKRKVSKRFKELGVKLCS